jgi:hypothetical protein
VTVGCKGKGSMGIVNEIPNDDCDWTEVAEVRPVEALEVAAGVSGPGEDN